MFLLGANSLRFLILLIFLNTLSCNKNDISFVKIEKSRFIFNRESIDHEINSKSLLEVEDFIKYKVNNKTFKFKVTFNSHGNGSLYFKNKQIFIQDSNANPEIYKDDYLTVFFYDINKDGFMDLVFEGVIETINEKGHYVINERRLCEIAYYDKQKKDFVFQKFSKEKIFQLD